MSSKPLPAVRSPRRLLALGLLLLSGWVSLAGCGRKEPPLPPLRAIPAAAESLTVAQQGRELVLRFTYPTETVDRVILTPADVREVQLWALARPAPRAAVEGAPAPTPQPVDARQLAGSGRLVERVEKEDLPTILSGDQVLMRVPLPELEDPPQAYFFAARTVGPTGEPSELSNQAVIVPRTPPEPTAGLALEPRQEGVVVSWDGAEATSDTRGFHVYRRDPQTRRWGEPLHRVAADVSEWTDTSARFGQGYIYAVTRVVATSPLIESAPGGTRELFYEDRFPPAPPRGLVVLGEEGRVRLVWEASPSPDAAGYRVYRVPAQGVLEAVTEELVSGLEYVDGGLPPGGRVTYRVSAVDDAGNEGDPGPAVSAVVR